MTIKRILTGLSVSAVLFLNACDDNESTPKEQFSFGTESVTLADANLFLRYTGIFADTHSYRGYVITDGDVYGSGATYFIEFDLAVPKDEQLAHGAYPTFKDWDLPSETSNMSYLYAENEIGGAFAAVDLQEDAKGRDKLIVSGGVGDGETMIIKFTGTLAFTHIVNEAVVTEDVSSRLFFKAKVQDMRD